MLCWSGMPGSVCLFCLDSIVIQIFRELLVAYLIKGPREVHDKDICLFAIFHVHEYVRMELEKLHLTGSFVMKTMLKFVEDVIFTAMFHNLTLFTMMCSTTLQHMLVKLVKLISQ